MSLFSSDPIVPTDVPYTSSLTEDVIRKLTEEYPFVERLSIGKSVMGREIWMLKIGTGERQVFYNASFHANEWITTPMLLKFAEEYIRAVAQDSVMPQGSAGGGSAQNGTMPQDSAGGGSAQQDRENVIWPPASELYRKTALYLVPLVNPDGVDLVTGALSEGEYYARAAQIAANYPDIPFPDGWKANIDGVDLNLQFPAGWELAKEIKYSQGFTKPAPRDYVGSGSLTAPESVAVYELTLRSDFRLILCYHTQGEVIYWKYKDYEPECSREIAEAFAESSGYALQETPAASGNAGYKDWFIQVYNRPGYTIEAGLGENPLPISQFDEIYRRNLGILIGGLTETCTTN